MIVTEILTEDRKIFQLEKYVLTESGKSPVWFESDGEVNVVIRLVQVRMYFCN